MKFLVLSLTLVLSSKVFAEGALHAHEHGSIVLETAVEGKVVTFSVDGPAESFLGFEYEAKSAKEKKVFADTKNLWTKKFFELVSFDKSLGCKLSEGTFEQEVEKEEHKDEHKKDDKKEEGIHSDIEASIKVTCAKDLKGAKILVNLKKHFKNIKKLKMDLVGNETKSIDINSDSFEVTL